MCLISACVQTFHISASVIPKNQVRFLFLSVFASFLRMTELID